MYSTSSCGEPTKNRTLHLKKQACYKMISRGLYIEIGSENLEKKEITLKNYCRCKDKAELDCKKLWCKSVELIHLAQDRDHW
jgi:hypothetical protein